MTERTIYLPQPQLHQRQFLDFDALYKVICAGRQMGKTMACAVACIYGHGPTLEDGTPKYKGAVFGKVIWWTTKDFPTARKIWRDLKKFLKRWGGKLDINETDWRIDFPGGGAVEVKSAATSVRKESGGLRGDTIDGLVLDEAAFCPESTWASECEPMLGIKQGWAIFISSPNGQNWFYNLWELGNPKNPLRPETLSTDDTTTGVYRDPEWRSWQLPTSANPYMTPSRLAKIQARKDKYVWAREYLAQFDVEGGVVFERQWFKTYKRELFPRELAGGRTEEIWGFQAYTDDGKKFGDWVPRDGMYVFVTADFAMTTRTSSDYSAIAAWGMSKDGRLWMLDLVRERLEWDAVVPLTKKIYDRHQARVLCVEASGPLVRMNQEAAKIGMNVVEWKIHEGPLSEPKDKVARNGPAAPHVQAGRVLFPAAVPWLNLFCSECCAFPGGEHDDMVDCLGIAVWHALLMHGLGSEEAREQEERLEKESRFPAGTFPDSGELGEDQQWEETPSW